MTSRKRRAGREERNIGPVIDLEIPENTQDSVLMVDRLLRSLLQDTIDQLKDNREELTRFFSHFFDPTVSVAERNEFITNFMNKPPRAILGYARSSAQFPVFAVVLESEDEADAFLGDYVGKQILGSPDGINPSSEYTGAFFNATYSIYIYTEHPDVCSYLWQFAKAVAHSGKALLLSCGVQEVTLSGGELAPDESYMPENMFVRVLRVQTKQQFTAPRVMDVDPARFKMTGLFMNDINVDGLQGGVVPVEEYLGDSDD